MTIKRYSIRNLGLLAGVLVTGALISVGTMAAETTVLVVSDAEGGGTTAEFVGGVCPNKALGKSGCLVMKKGKKNKSFKLFFSDETVAENWKWVSLEIRTPFADWGDPVDPDILSDLSIPGANFNDQGQADISSKGNNFKIMNKNDHKFIVQYRIKLSNGTPSEDFWVHPAFENEGEEEEEE